MIRSRNLPKKWLDNRPRDIPPSHPRGGTCAVRMHLSSRGTWHDPSSGPGSELEVPLSVTCVVAHVAVLISEMTSTLWTPKQTASASATAAAGTTQERAICAHKFTNKGGGETECQSWKNNSLETPTRKIISLFLLLGGLNSTRYIKWYAFVHQFSLVVSFVGVGLWVIDVEAHILYIHLQKPTAWKNIK